jgi:hypothetical protein
VWFVGVTPRRNPELVVAVLWQNGEFSYYPARIGAKIVSAYVEKQRRLANNLVQPKVAAPTEMSAVWTAPNPSSGSKANDPSAASERVQSGHFLVDQGQIVSRVAQTGSPALKGHGFSRAGNDPTKASALAAEGIRGRKKALPQRLKPGVSSIPSSGTAKAVPFQGKTTALPGKDPQPTLAASGKGQ